MMENRRKLTLALLLAMFPLSAMAYVDPGSGMLVWQGLVAAIGAVIVFVRNPGQALRRLIDRFKRRK